ncbi:uncharacterized protein LOC120928808 [Rana temporaria]|uniref:uncharacterized protein LOC120928808 n=1 Tax=Rana temporaria TaxID=8407 RepID=UPI001AAD9CD3|nr:uncharacterized protein LOC120928808 [Rana temporaria]XP_040195753.1 uncharacterized protein LOC120928808 [Rana temporaria]
MPKCVVRRCPHRTGEKSMFPQIVLHPFPKNILLIKDWLRLAGMQEENLEIVSLEILGDRRSDKYRMCSAHFTQDSYVLKGSKRVLKADAKPSTFPEISSLDFAHPPMMHKIAQRARIGKSVAIPADDRPVKAKCKCKCHAGPKPKLVDSSTQTEESDSLILESVDPYRRLTNHQNVDVDLGYSQALCQEHPTAEETMAIKVPPSPNRIPVKKWEVTDFPILGEKKHNDNVSLNSEATRSYKGEDLITSEEPSFEIITVEDWEATEIQTKQESFQNGNGFLHLGEMDSENGRNTEIAPSFRTVSNQKRADHVTEGKKEFIGNGNGFLHLGEMDSESGRNTEIAPPFHTVSNRKRGDHVTEGKKEFIENGSWPLDKPSHATVVPSFGKSPFTKKEGEKDKVKKPDPLTSSLIESSAGDLSNATKAKRRKNGQEAILSDPLNPSSDEENTGPSTSPLSLEEKYAKEKKYLVFESCLDVLLLNMRCQQEDCSEKIQRYDKHAVGSLLVVFATCRRGHHCKLWESQPRVNGVGAGNVLLATMLVLTGSSFTKIKGLCDIIALQIFSESSFHKYEDTFIFPSIDQWIREEDESEMMCATEEEDAVLDRRRSV